MAYLFITNGLAANGLACKSEHYMFAMIVKICRGKRWMRWCTKIIIDLSKVNKKIESSCFKWKFLLKVYIIICSRIETMAVQSDQKTGAILAANYSLLVKLIRNL